MPPKHGQSQLISPVSGLNAADCPAPSSSSPDEGGSESVPLVADLTAEAADSGLSLAAVVTDDAADEALALTVWACGKMGRPWMSVADERSNKARSLQCSKETRAT